MIDFQVCNAVQLDLVFMIDESNSVGDSDFTDVKFWLRNIISSLPVGTSYTQVKQRLTYNCRANDQRQLAHIYVVEPVPLVQGWGIYGSRVKWDPRERLIWAHQNFRCQC